MTEEISLYFYTSVKRTKKKENIQWGHIIHQIIWQESPNFIVPEVLLKSRRYVCVGWGGGGGGGGEFLGNREQVQIFGARWCFTWIVLTQ